MDKSKRVMTIMHATPKFGHRRRLTLWFACLATQLLSTVVHGHTPRLDTCWPAFDYDGKPAQTDGSYSKTMVADSRTFRLGGIDSGAKYQMEFYHGPKKTVEGFECEDWTVTLAPRSFQLIFYRQTL
jgi:hypothetical protein